MKNKRKSFLIYPSVQKRIIGIFVFAGGLGFLGLAGGAVLFTQKVFNLIEESGVLQAPQNQINLSELWTQFAFFLILFGIGYVIVLFLLGLVFSHKLVGPLIRISRDLGRMIEKNEFREMRTRESDYLAELIGQFNGFISQRNQSGNSSDSN